MNSDGESEEEYTAMLNPYESPPEPESRPRQELHLRAILGEYLKTTHFRSHLATFSGLAISFAAIDYPLLYMVSGVLYGYGLTLSGQGLIRSWREYRECSDDSDDDDDDDPDDGELLPVDQIRGAV